MNSSSTATTTTPSTSSTSQRINNETSDLSLSEQSSFTTSPHTERKTTNDAPNQVTNAPQAYQRNSSCTKSGTLSSSNYSTNQSSQNSSVGFVWKPNSGPSSGRQPQLENHIVQDTKDSRSSGSERSDKPVSKSSKTSFSTESPVHIPDLEPNQMHQNDQNAFSNKSPNHSKPQNHVNQLINNFNKMFPQGANEKLSLIHI